MADETSGFGQQDPSSSASDYNERLFIIQQQLALISTAKLVQVKAVDTSAKTVDVQPMVNQLDGQGNSSPHGTILGISYMQWQFGPNAIVSDPVVGDKGMMVCCDRDISSAVAAKAIANPGSDRQLDAADGIYLGGLLGLNDEPTQTVKFTDTGLEFNDKNSNSLVSGPTGWEFTGIVKFNSVAVLDAGLQLAGNIAAVGGGSYSGNFETTGSIKAGSIDLELHHHTAQGATAPTTVAQP